MVESTKKGFPADGEGEMHHRPDERDVGGKSIVHYQCDAIGMLGDIIAVVLKSASDLMKIAIYFRPLLHSRTFQD